MNKVAYICDRKKSCNKSPSCGITCRTTLDISHAKNFESIQAVGGVTLYREKQLVIVPSPVIEPDTLEAPMKRLTKASNQLKADLIDAMAHGIKAYNAQLKRKGNKE